MISITPEKGPLLRELISNAEKRLGVRKIAGGIGLRKPLPKICITRCDSVMDLYYLTSPETICIIPWRVFQSPGRAQKKLFNLSNIILNSGLAASTCIAISGADDMADSLVEGMGKSENLLFSSDYDEFLLESRLIGLLREISERRTTLSGGLVNLNDFGFLITGESGLGKTEFALELVKRGHRWIADDVVVVEKRSNGFLYGKGYDFKFPLLELKGQGVVRAEDVMPASSIMFETKLDFSIELVECGSIKKENVSDNPLKRLNIMGVYLPCVKIQADRDASRMVRDVEKCLRFIRCF
jgi:HPr kinase/phosphorylase